MVRHAILLADVIGQGNPKYPFNFFEVAEPSSTLEFES